MGHGLSQVFTEKRHGILQKVPITNNYFELIKLIQLATKKLKNSTNELYRNRFSDQYNITRVAMQSDSVDLSILNNKILNEFSFAVDNEKWKTIFETDPDAPERIDLDSFKDDITQIARNRWAEGIYDISLSEIISKTILDRTNYSAKVFMDCDRAVTYIKSKPIKLIVLDYNFNQTGLAIKNGIEFIRDFKE